MFVKFKKITDGTKHGHNGIPQKLYGFKVVAVNPEHVTIMEENDGLRKSMESSGFPVGVSKRSKFTELYVNMGNGMRYNVVGSFATVFNKLNQNSAPAEEASDEPEPEMEDEQ